MPEKKETNKQVKKVPNIFQKLNLLDQAFLSL